MKCSNCGRRFTGDRKIKKIQQQLHKKYRQDIPPPHDRKIINSKALCMFCLSEMEKKLEGMSE